MWDRLQGNQSPRPTLKDIKADLLAYPDISTMMDVVVIDIPAAYGMLLSRKWSAELESANGLVLFIYSQC